MSGFTKLQSSIIHSTIWREPDHIRIVWITMLAVADSNGYVKYSIEDLASKAKVSHAGCREAIKLLMSPNKSNNQNEDTDGRRIEMVEGGFRIFEFRKLYK